MPTFQKYRRAMNAMADMQTAIDAASADIAKIDAKIIRLQDRREELARERAALTAGAADIGRRVGLIPMREAAE